MSFFLVICLSGFITSLFLFQYVESKGLNGITLRFTGYDNPPYDKLERTPDGNYTISGPNAKVHVWLSQKLNYTYSIVDPLIDKEVIAKYGLYEPAFSKVIRKEVDGILGSLIVNPDRAERMDFSFMVWAEPYTIVAPKPKPQSRLFAFIRPFQPTVWLCLGLSGVGFILIMSWFSLLYNHSNFQVNRNVEGKEPKYLRDQNEDCNTRTINISNFELTVNTISYYVVYVLNILTNHGIYSPYAQHSFRILAGGWLLAALVLVNSYSSIVVSSLTVPVMNPAINSFEDLANSKDVSIILHSNVVISKVILSATTGVFKTLGDQARNHPDGLHIIYPTLLKKLETGHFGYPFVRSFNRDFIVQQYKKDGECRFRLSPPLVEVPTGYFCLLLQKNFAHTAAISLALTYLWETGITRYWVLNEMPNVYECFDTSQKPRQSVRQVGIKLEDLISAFLILGIGTGLSLISFLFEKIVCSLQQHRNP